MPLKAAKPARGNGTGFGNVIVLQATDISENTHTQAERQPSAAAQWLARRANLTVETAAAVAEAKAWGRP